MPSRLSRHLQATPPSLLNNSYLALHREPLPCTRNLCCLVTKTVWEGDFDGRFVSHVQGVMTCRWDGPIGHTPRQKSGRINTGVQIALVSRATCWCACLCTVFVGLKLTSSSESTIVHLLHHRTSITVHQSHASWSLTSHTTLPPEQFIPCLARGTRTSAALSPKLFGRATLMVRSCHTDKVL